MQDKTQEQNNRTTVVVSFRVDAAVQDKIKENSKKAGLSPRVWLEKAILENRTSIVARQKPHPDLRALLFQISRAGNNINQLAYKFNLLHKMGEVGADECGQAIARLDDIADSLREALEHAR